VGSSDSFGLARKYAQRYRECNEDEYRQCGEQCKPNAVKKCGVTETFKPRQMRLNQSGSMTEWEWVIVNFDCRCQDCEDESATKRFFDWLLRPRPKPEPDPLTGERPRRPNGTSGPWGVPGPVVPVPTIP